MLKRELLGEEFTKTVENAELRRHLNDRSKGAVEFKFQNISAVLDENGWRWVKGYKPQSNFQQSLRDEVVRQVEGDSELQSLIAPSSTDSPRDAEPGNRQHTHPSGPGEWNSQLFAERLNLLFENELGPNGLPYTTEEVVRALQYEGIPVSPSQLAALRSGTGERPASATINSIAFFFNATLDYLNHGTGEGHRVGKAGAQDRTDTELTNALVSAFQSAESDARRFIVSTAALATAILDVHEAEVWKRTIDGETGKLYTSATTYYKAIGSRFPLLHKLLRDELCEELYSADPDAIGVRELAALVHVDPSQVSRSRKLALAKAEAAAKAEAEAEAAAARAEAVETAAAEAAAEAEANGASEAEAAAAAAAVQRLAVAEA
jgi:transcriptional regulator with XRE-family HTH domain